MIINYQEAKKIAVSFFSQIEQEMGISLSIVESHVRENDDRWFSHIIQKNIQKHLQRSLSVSTITIKMRANVLSPPVCGLGYGEAAFEQVAVFVFGRGVWLGLVLLPKPQLGDGAAQAGIVAEDAEMALVERLQDGAAECVLEVV